MRSSILRVRVRVLTICCQVRQARTRLQVDLGTRVVAQTLMSSHARGKYDQHSVHLCPPFAVGTEYHRQSKLKNNPSMFRANSHQYEHNSRSSTRTRTREANGFSRSFKTMTILPEPAIRTLRSSRWVSPDREACCRPVKRNCRCRTPTQMSRK